MKTLFVTGGAGFIGSEFIRLVLKKSDDYKIINYDALSYAGNLENLKDIDADRHTFIKGDICDRQAVLSALPDEADGIINFAAESHVDRSISSAHEFVTTNVLGTQVLLDCAREKKVGRFLQVSTDEVMGSLPERNDAFFTESSMLQPNSPYAASKAAAEHFVRAAFETFGLDVVITRCGNNYGYRQFPEKLIPLMIANALNDEPLPLYGDGQNVRDWIFVTDHCEAIWQVFKKGRSNEVYNIGARNTKKNIEIVTSILDILGKPHSLIKRVSDRLGHDRRYAINPEKVESELNWKPKVSWDDALDQTIEWYISNEDWVESIRNGQYRDYYQQMYQERLQSASQI